MLQLLRSKDGTFYLTRGRVKITFTEEEAHGLLSQLKGYLTPPRSSDFVYEKRTPYFKPEINPRDYKHYFSTPFNSVRKMHEERRRAKDDFNET